MRVNLEADGSAFLQQVQSLRRHLGKMGLLGGQAAVSSRMMTPVFVPYLTVLRSELRDEVVPREVLDGAADLIANIAKTTVQSLIEAPAEAEGATVEELLMAACKVACEAIHAEAAGKKPKLALVPKQDSVIHRNGRRPNPRGT